MGVARGACLSSSKPSTSLVYMSCWNSLIWRKRSSVRASRAVGLKSSSPCGSSFWSSSSWGSLNWGTLLRVPIPAIRGRFAGAAWVPTVGPFLRFGTPDLTGFAGLCFGGILSVVWL